MFKLAIVAAALVAVVGGGQSVFAQAAISEPGAYAFYHPDADVLNAGRPTFPDSAPMRLRTNAIPGSIATHERRGLCRDIIAAPPPRA